MNKFLWGKCIPHYFIRYLYKQVSYIEISKPNLTYQKANNIVKNFILEFKIKTILISIFKLERLRQKF